MPPRTLGRAVSAALILLLHLDAWYRCLSMKVAIVGGGFAGLSVGLRLARHCQALHFFDPRPAGQAAASSISGGLMHPTAPRGNLMWKGMEGFLATRQVIDELSSRGFANLMNDKPVRLWRPVFNNKDLLNWDKASAANPAIVERVKDEDAQLLPCFSTGALACFRVNAALVVRSTNYLRAMWQAIQQDCPSATWSLSSINGISDLQAKFDKVVLANSYNLPRLYNQLPDTAPLHVHFVRGRIFHYPAREVVIEGAHPSSSDAFLNGEYIVSIENQILGGATHEHWTADEAYRTTEESYTFKRQPLDGGPAEQKLSEKLGYLMPSLVGQPALQSSAMRITTERSHFGRLPIVGKHPNGENVWVFGGLGSKGLIYHALMGSMLADAILSNNASAILACLRPESHSS